jgi:hypothetical protein
VLVSLDAARRQALIAAAAEAIRRRGMTAPAILFLEANRPFSFIAGQALLVAEPLLGLLVGYEHVRDWGLVLEDRQSLELLIQYLEAGRAGGGS